MIFATYPHSGCGERGFVMATYNRTFLGEITPYIMRAVLQCND
jgi:hypothetical protein